MSAFRHDPRVAPGALLRSPARALVATATLAVVLGAVTVVSSVVQTAAAGRPFETFLLGVPPLDPHAIGWAAAALGALAFAAIAMPAAQAAPAGPVWALRCGQGRGR